MVLALALIAGASVYGESKPGALVLVNSEAADYPDFGNFLEPYLVQFGVPCDVHDLARGHLGTDVESYALVIIGHRGLDVTHHLLSARDEQTLLAAVQTGTGLVSFDGLLVGWKDGKPEALSAVGQGIFDFTFVKPEEASVITVGASAVASHGQPPEDFITSSEPTPRTLMLKKAFAMTGLVPGPQVQILAYAGNQPLLVTAPYGRGRAVLWISYEWTKPDVKGKIYGLDDLVWRGFVWAARKPLVLRGMPHYLALRVDDVAGFGLGSNRHLGFVATANHYGLKPWLGIFVDDLRNDPEAIKALTGLTRDGLATASVHARTWDKFFYLNEPLLNDGSGTNIAARDLESGEIAANFVEAEQFFKSHGIRKSKYVIPHFYEFGTNDFEGLEHWGAQFVGTVLEPGRGYGTRLLAAAPYLAHEPIRPSNGSDPIFIADWLTVPNHPEYNRRFFNFVEEVRDVTGYEWAPSHVSVAEAVRRGVVESRREFDSLLPAVLFTHESDHIQYVQPDEWERILKGITDGLQPYQPIPVTLDFLAQYLRALRTSRIASAAYDPASYNGSIELEGAADLPTKFYVFESSGAQPHAREWEIPPFKGKTVVRWRSDSRE